MNAKRPHPTALGNETILSTTGGSAMPDKGERALLPAIPLSKLSGNLSRPLPRSFQQQTRQNFFTIEDLLEKIR